MVRLGRDLACTSGLSPVEGTLTTRPVDLVAVSHHSMETTVSVFSRVLMFALGLGASGAALAQEVPEASLDDCWATYGYSCGELYARYVYDKYGDMPWTEPEVTRTGVNGPNDFLDGIQAVSILEVDGVDLLVVEVSEAAAKVAPEKAEVFGTVSIGNGPVRVLETGVWTLPLTERLELGDTLVVVFDGDVTEGLRLDIKERRW